MALNILIVVLEKYAAQIFRVRLWISVSSFNDVCLYILTTYFPFTLILKMELACSI